MIVRDLVGGGGSVKLVCWDDCGCLAGGDNPLVCLEAMAGGPRLNDFSVAEREEPSLALISVEATGVGGRLVRGIVRYRGGLCLVRCGTWEFDLAVFGYLMAMKTGHLIK